MNGRGGQTLMFPCSYNLFVYVYTTSTHNGAAHVTCYTKSLTSCKPMARSENGTTFKDSLIVLIVGT